ncbi:MAG: OmpA family protein [Sulfurospirillum sp.]|nr:OmpA family protein [Sulfurospirillum sp.]
MKKIALAGLTLSLLIFSGCSQKNPEIDMDKSGSTTVSTADQKVSDISGVDANTMHSQNMQNAQNAIESMIANLESKTAKVFFDFDKYVVREDMQPVVATNAQIFNSTDAQAFSIKVEGNSDEWGTDEYNYALGLKRAKSVKDSLVAQGVAGERIMMVSYGESNPTCKESNKTCWAQNRRAEFKLLP